VSRRLAAVLLLAASAVAGCGVTPTDPFVYGDAPANRVEGVRLYLRFEGRKFVVMRPGPRDLPAAALLDLLLAGPSDVERAAGIGSAVPPGYSATVELVREEGPRLLVVVDRPEGVDLDGFGEDAGEQIACTILPGGVSPRVVVRSPAGEERGPYLCK
jgi:hypothetical protein